MRTITLLKIFLAMKHVLVRGFEFKLGALVLLVSPSWRKTRCSGCGAVRPGYDRLGPRNWRHLNFGEITVLLRYAPRWVDCPCCGVVVEKVPWSEHAAARFTTPFEETVAFLTQCTDKTSVKNMFGISWSTVGAIVERVVERLRPEDLLEGLKRIGVDELSYRKGHRYLTLVTNHDTNRIVWGMEGKTADTFNVFFDELGQKRCQEIEAVTMDMSQSYISVRVPHAQIIFDRYHVQRLVSDALDETRREEWRRLKDEFPDEAAAVKGLRWPTRTRWRPRSGRAVHDSTKPRNYGSFYTITLSAGVTTRRQL